MTMKNKLFSRGLYVEGLRQLKIVGIIFLAVVLLIGISIPVIQYVNYVSYVERMEEMGEVVNWSPDVVGVYEMCGMSFLIALVAAPVFTFMLFSPFNRRSPSDFYHSLPYTRICMFTSFSAAILTWVAALTVIYCAVGIGSCAIFPQVFIVNLSGLFDALLTLVAYALMLVFGIIAAMSLTGTPLANITCAGLLLFLPRLLITLVTFVMGEIAPIISGHYGIFGTDYNALVNLVYRLFAVGDMETLMDNIASDIYSIIIGLLYAVLAAYLFTSRKSETAGHAAPGKKMHHIIRICVGFVVSSIVTCAVISGLEIEVAIVFYIVSVIIYFAYELITQKTFKTIKSTLPGLAILLGLNIAIVCVCFGCAAYVHSYEPANDDVESIYLENPTSDYRSSLSFGEYALEAAGRIKIEDRNAIEIATKNLIENNQRSKDGKFHSFMYEDFDDDKHEFIPRTELHIVYVSKLGIKRTRNIYISTDDYSKMMEYIQTNEAYKEVFFKLPDAVNRSFRVYETYDHNFVELPDGDLAEIYDCLKAEIQTLDFTTWATYLASGTANYGGFEFSYRPVGEDIALNVYFDGEILPKTTALIIEKINKASGELSHELYEILTDYEAAEKKYESIYMNMSAVDTERKWNLYHHYYKDDGIKNNDASEEFVSDLKALGEGIKSGKVESDKFIVVYLEYSELANDTEDHVYHSGTMFIPYPDGFEPESDNFDIVEVYVEDEYKYYEDVVIYD